MGSDGVPPTGASSRWDFGWVRWMHGPAVMALALLTVEAGRRVLGLPNPGAPVVLAVTYGAFVSGLSAGFFCAAMGLAYCALVLSVPGRPFRFVEPNSFRLLTLAPVIPLTALLVGVLRRRLDRANVLLLLEHRAKSDSIVEALQDGVVVFQDGRVLEANPGFCRMTGFPREEVVGRRPPFPWWPGDGGEEAAAMDRAGAGERVDLDREYVRKSGERFPAMLTLSPVRGAGGAVTGVAATVKDATDRRRAERELRGVVAHARCILWHADVTARQGWDADPPDLPSYFNWRLEVEEEQAALRILPLRINPGENFSEAWRRSEYPEDAARMDLTSSAALVAGESFYTHDFRCTDADGRLRWLHEDVSVEPAGHARWRAFGVVTDVTDQRLAEAAARSRDAQLRLAVTAAKMGHYTWDLSTGRVDRSPAALKILGLEGSGPVEEFYARVHADDRGRVASALTRAVEAGGALEVEYRLARADGSVAWVAERGEVFRDDAGRPTQVSGVVTDVTERVLAERALHENQQRLALAQRAGNIGTFDWDARTGETTWSPEVGEVYGLSPGEVASRNGRWESLVHPDDLPALRRATARALASAGEAEVTVRVVRSDGEVRWVLVRGRVFAGAGGGGRMLGILMDVTERTAAEQALRESEQRLRSLADAMPQIVWAADGGGKVEYYNRRWFEYTGFGEGDPQSPWVWAVLHPDDAEPTAARWAAALAQGKPEEFEYRFRRADGAYRWHLGRIVPVVEGGAVTRWFGTATDIDDRKRAAEELRSAKEAAESANRAKDQFLAVLSHELRTPLTPVLMGVQALEAKAAGGAAAAGNGAAAGGGDGGEFAATLAMIRRNVELEARLIDDLLDLTRIAKGKLKLVVSSVDVHSALASALDICRNDVSAKGLHVLLDLAAPARFVAGDPARLQQVLWNLIKNAVKFTPAGGRISVRTSNTPDDAGGRALLVSVADTGVGIDPDVLPKVFDAFEQGDPSVTRRFGGLGLGLAISKALVDLHGGRLSAASPGKGLGATFTVELPTAAAPGAGGTRPAGKAGDGRSLRILMVDDHEDTARALSRLLERLGHRVRTAGSVAAAVTAADAERFDLLVSDIGLPDGSGLDVIRRVSRMYPVRGIALSGFGMDEDVRRSREAGFFSHITKPINFQTLQDAIRDVMAEAAPEDP